MTSSGTWEALILYGSLVGVSWSIWEIQTLFLFLSKPRLFGGRFLMSDVRTGPGEGCLSGSVG